MEYQQTYDIVRTFMQNKIYSDKGRVTALHYSKNKQSIQFVEKRIEHLNKHFFKVETRLNKQDVTQYARKAVQISENNDFTNIKLSMHSIREVLMESFPENKCFWAYQVVFISWYVCVCTRIYELNSVNNTAIDYIVQETINIVSSEIRENGESWDKFLDFSVQGLLIPPPNAFKLTLLVGIVVLFAWNFFYRRK